MIDDAVDIKQKIDKAFEFTREPRDRAADDWIFAHFNQWDEYLEDYSDNEYRGQFDIISRQVRQVKSEMLANPISVKYRAVGGDESNKEAAETLQGMYRASMRTNMAKEALDIAIDSQVSVGFGAWRICTEYEDHGENDVTTQRIVRKPIHEANNTVYFDPAATRRDKSDAKWGGILTRYTKDSHKELCEEYGCENHTGASAATPANSGVFAFSGGDYVWVAEHYEVKTKKKKVLVMSNGYETITVPRNKGDEVAALADMGYDVTARKEVKVREVNKYIIDGDGIIDGPVRVAGEHIPIIPVFGEWRYIEGQEYWEGMVRRAKDPQRLHNMGMSFVADQMGRSPRRKPVFTDEQIRGHEYMYTTDADYAYYLMNARDEQGQPIDRAIQYMEGPQITGAEATFLQLTEKAVQDVTVTPVVGENALSDGVTEGQLRLANSQNQMQTFVYQHNLATAMRRDGEIYQSIASEIYIDEMEVPVMGEDDSTEMVVINEQGYNNQGLPYIKNEVSDVSFEVYTDVGPAFQDQKDAAKATLLETAQALGAQDPLGRLAYLQYLTMLDVPGGDDFEDFIKIEALKAGIRKPKNEEEQAVMMQIQQAAANRPPTAQDMIGQAEMMKAQADVMSAQTDLNNSQYEAAKSIADAEYKQAQTAEILSKLQQFDLERLGKVLDLIEKGQQIDNNTIGQLTQMYGGVQ